VGNGYFDIFSTENQGTTVSFLIKCTAIEDKKTLDFRNWQDE
jgi:hypothetical protein